MKWISHRGFHLESVENTTDAFERAQREGFEHIETDLRITLDGHIVLCHDENLQRIAGSAENVHKLCRKDLENIRLPRKQRLAFIEDVFQDFRHLKWTFDIKETSANRCIDSLIILAGSHKVESWIESNVKFLVWKSEHREKLKLAFPNAEFYATFKESQIAGACVLTGLNFLSGIEPGKTYGLTPRFFGINLFQKKIADQYHSQSAFLNAFLPKDRHEVKLATTAGFDEILSDFPPLL